MLFQALQGERRLPGLVKPGFAPRPPPPSPPSAPRDVSQVAQLGRRKPSKIFV